MDIVPAVVDGWLAEAIVKAETTRHQIEQTPSERFGDMSDAVLYRDSGRAENVFDLGSDTDAGVFDELEGFIKDALDQRLVEEFKFRSHVFVRLSFRAHRKIPVP
jgi:hypothetical protein